MRVLILGGAGMLGHKLWQVLRTRGDVWVTVRSDYRDYARFELFDAQRTLDRVDAADLDTILRAVATVQPDVMINCIGIIKQRPTAQDPVASLTINSMFPHRLASLCRASGARLIHISTDCVFSGRKGMYTEEDVSDAEDLYGRTKYLGEVGAPGCLTLRTSIIGRELQTTSGLVEWFLSQRSAGKSTRVQGYRRAIYTGFTTLAMARIIANVIEHHTDLSGVYQVSAEPISKFDLLCLVRAVFEVPIVIEPDETVQIDRSLDSRRFRTATGFVPPAWSDMICEMADDPTPYEKWRNGPAS